MLGSGAVAERDVEQSLPMISPIPTGRPSTAMASAETLVEVLSHWARSAPNQEALEFQGRRTTFGQLDELSRGVAAGLADLGLRRGDRVIYYARNSDDFFTLLFGAARLGVVVVPVNWRLSATEAAQIVENAGAKAIFAGAGFAERLAQALGTQATERPIIAVADSAGPGLRAWISSHPTDADQSVLADDVVLQLYTSGTTGRPKGAMLTHRAFLEPQRLRRAAGVAWDIASTDDVTLVSMPLGHIGGSRMGVLSLAAGAKVVVAPEFSVDGLLDLISRCGVSRMFIVPNALRQLLDDPRTAGVDFSRLKVLFYGASPMPAQLLRESMAVIRCGFVQLYGMTESCGGVVALSPEDHLATHGPRMGSTGRALPGVELAIVSSEGRRLGPGEDGEILVRSASIMAGYWNDTAATRAAIDADGFLHTGDIGALDADGYLYIRDRLKDVVISGGENIYSAEVEAALLEHPQVAEAAVIGVPDDRWGEAVKAIVVARPGAEPHAPELMAWARERLGFKAPKSLEFIDELPRNGSGKVLKRTFRERYWKGLDKQVN